MKSKMSDGKVLISMDRTQAKTLERFRALLSASMAFTSLADAAKTAAESVDAWAAQFAQIGEPAAEADAKPAGQPDDTQEAKP